jgi:hypothetical protein
MAGPNFLVICRHFFGDGLFTAHPLLGDVLAWGLCLLWPERAVVVLWKLGVERRQEIVYHQFHLR